MGRQAADLFERNRYARRVAAYRAAEMLRDNAIGVASVRELRVEAVDRQIFDDLLETWMDGSLHGWQIKSQTTPLARDQLREIFAALRDQPDLAAGHLALEAHFSIQGIGELRQLRRLCQNLQARGADETAVCASATRGELSWLAFLDEIAGDRRRALDLARRIHVDVLGDDQQLRGANPRRTLRPVCPTPRCCRKSARGLLPARQWHDRHHGGVA